MNTKLIKQLESVGFESRGFESILKIGENYIFYYYHNIDDFTGYLDAEIIEDSNGRCVYIRPTFEEIVAAVKERTGVDLLQPKPTKTQRIEALEQGNQSLAEQIEELRVKQQGFEDLLKALNEKVSESEVSETPTPKVENEPKFKVGDEVVLNLEKKCVFDSNICNAVENRLVLTIESVNVDSGIVSVLIDGGEYYFDFSEIEHAPKLKFGGWAEVIGNTVVTHRFEIGQKVLLYYTKGDYVWCSDGDSCCLVARADLKPLYLHIHIFFLIL